MPADHLVERFEIDQRGRANPYTIGLRGAVAHDVVAQFAFGRLNRVINLSRRRLQHFADFAEDRPGGNFLDGLQADLPRLPHLFQPHHVPVVRVAVLSRRYAELVLIVSRIRHRLTDVPLHAARAQYGPGNAHGNRIVRLEYADALGSAHPDAVFGEQGFVFIHALVEIFAESLDVLLQFVVSLVLQAADAEGMRGQPRAAILLENLQDLFAF